MSRPKLIIDKPSKRTSPFATDEERIRQSELDDNGGYWWGIRTPWHARAIIVALKHGPRILLETVGAVCGKGPNGEALWIQLQVADAPKTEKTAMWQIEAALGDFDIVLTPGTWIARLQRELR